MDLFPGNIKDGFLRGITSRLSLNFLNKELEFERAPQTWGNGRLVVLVVKTRRHIWGVAGSMAREQNACREWRDGASSGHDRKYAMSWTLQGL